LSPQELKKKEQECNNRFFAKGTEEAENFGKMLLDMQYMACSLKPWEQKVVQPKLDLCFENVEG
jgi:hypothetical protein